MSSNCGRWKNNSQLFKQAFGLQLATDPAFFGEWKEVNTTVTENE
ncbi:MAG: hypothetical protein SNJ85_04935 [Cyanobacteriota bacterium]